METKNEAKAPLILRAVYVTSKTELQDTLRTELPVWENQLSFLANVVKASMLVAKKSQHGGFTTWPRVSLS